MKREVEHCVIQTFHGSTVILLKIWTKELKSLDEKKPGGHMIKQGLCLGSRSRGDDDVL